jgi:hypothetical protein
MGNSPKTFRSIKSRNHSALETPAMVDSAITASFSSSVTGMSKRCVNLPSALDRPDLDSIVIWRLL